MKRRIAHPRLRALLVGALTILIPCAGAIGARAAAPPASSAQAKPAPKAAHKTAKSRAVKPVAAKSSRATSARPGTAGMKAAIDPATGKLVRPTAEQVQALDAQSAVVRAAADDDPSRGIPVLRQADGSEIAHLDERFHDYEVARIGPDGKLVKECVHGPEGVARFRKAAQAQATAPVAPAPKKELQ